MTVTDAAEALGVSRKTLSAILNGRAGISQEMAIRLSKAFGTSAESWLSQQMQHDLWIAEQSAGEPWLDFLGHTYHERGENDPAEFPFEVGGYYAVYFVGSDSLDFELVHMPALADYDG